MTKEEKLNYINENMADVMEMTGKGPEELLAECEYYEANKTYVRFNKGKYKGTVGYMLPSDELMPYTRIVYTADGCEIMCNGWSWTDLDNISKEEYEKALEMRNRKV